MYYIITQPNCPWCDKVKALLQERNIDFEVWQPEKSILSKIGKIMQFRTVPQVFNENGARIGGYENTVEYLNDLESWNM